jgi:hypothetical protein
MHHRWITLYRSIFFCGSKISFIFIGTYTGNFFDLHNGKSWQYDYPGKPSGGVSMTSTFTNIIEDMKTLSLEEKEELKFLLDRYVIEERRSEIYNNYKLSQKEFQENTLEFTSNIDRLKEMMNQ